MAIIKTEVSPGLIIHKEYFFHSVQEDIDGKYSIQTLKVFEKKG